ncbi:hypothetical protein DFP72DRAFT_1066759 [Ephemerocybe angulata]|uniref:Uncharacterized protein n=1 Tax=Ephemerocybe angulata TaxID=980116 RepID=A0A8H6M9V0_9AGAR|nr:hypothetical protein DFP72DRAFT_1066759 [Tulosesus angulatus]
MTVSKAAQYTPPVVGTTHPTTGKKSLPKVFAIPVHSDLQMSFIEHHYPEWRSLSGSEQMYLFEQNFPKFLPSGWRPDLTWIIVPVQKKVWQTLAIVICGNWSEDEMKKANDEKLVKEIQEVLGVQTPAGWYFVCDPDA